MADLLLIALLAIGLWLFLIAPGRRQRERRAFFEKRTFAHRGLYAKDQSVPENSLAAFAAAVQAGYGVELDVQLTKDKRLVVFHDDTLKRACGVDARLDAYTYGELRAMPLFGTNHRIPLFSDVLGVIDGRIPVIVELKSGGDWPGNCESTLSHLRACKGPYCVESFDPHIVRWFRKNAPDILRGQLSEAYRFSSKAAPWYTALLMSRVLTNVFTRPQFIAYRIGPKCLSVRAAEWLGAMRVCWTARPEHDWGSLTRQNDCIIFEHFRPETRFDGGKAPLQETIEQLDRDLKAEQRTCLTDAGKK